jgi:hypothetical protein
MCGPGSTKVTLSVPHKTSVPSPSTHTRLGHKTSVPSPRTHTGLGHKTPKSSTRLPIATRVPLASSGMIPSGTRNLPKTSLLIRPPYYAGHNSSSLLAEATAPSGTAPPRSTPLGTGSLPVGISSVSSSLSGTGSSGTAPALSPGGTGKPSYGGSKGDVTTTVVHTEIVTMTKSVETTTVTSIVTITPPCRGRNPDSPHVRNWLWR